MGVVMHAMVGSCRVSAQQKEGAVLKPMQTTGSRQQWKKRAVRIGNACARLPDPGPIGILALQVGPLGRGKAAALAVTRLCSPREPACFNFLAVGFWKLNVAPVS